MRSVLDIEGEKRRLLKFRNYFRLDAILSGAWRRFPVGSYLLRSHFDAVERPAYAFGVYSSCLLAKALNSPRVSVCEFGVAGGRGLLALEEAAIRIGDEVGVDVDVFGFDRGNGLASTTDYRDLPYWFQSGSFEMNAEALRGRLRKVRLILGDVRDTVRTFLDRFDAGPIGFCSFDLDYYSSTRDALQIFAGSDVTRLPRVICYFDDLVGISDLTLPCPKVGQELAIQEFNDSYPNGSLAPIPLLRSKRVIPAIWNEQTYAFHDFRHPLYNQPVNPFTPEIATRGSAITL